MIGRDFSKSTQDFLKTFKNDVKTKRKTILSKP